MTGLKYRLVFILLSLASLQIKASYRSEIYFVYIHNRMDLWKNVIDQIDAITDKNNELLLELVNYQYSLRKNNLAIINSYKAAFYGFRIGLSPVLAPVNGFKSIDCATESAGCDRANIHPNFLMLGMIFTLNF